MILVTEKVFEEDDNTENSSVQPASKQPSPVKKTSPEASKTATTKKQQIKNAKQQSSLTSFFKKK